MTESLLPSFSQGQVLSASAHLNILQNYVQGLRDNLLGTQMPFPGLYWTNDVPWSYAWSGMIRHKTNTFDYDIDILNSRLVELKVNGTTIASASSGSLTGSADISTLGLTQDEFYPVTLDTRNGAAHAIVWLLRERYTPTLPTLAGFLDEDVPTASDWQDLSNYASGLYAQLNHPCPLGVMTSAAPRTGNYPDVYTWAGNFNHRGRYLAYKIELKAPYHRGNYPDAGGERWMEARLYYGGTLAMKLRVGDSGTADGSEYYEEDTGGAGHGKTFEGTLDLDTYPGGLSVGSDYQVYLKATSSTFWDTVSRCKVHELYEVPASTATLTGWTNFATWSHGDYVYGNSNSPRVRWIKTNLEAIAAAATYSNYPAIGLPFDYYGHRRRRWLHYRNEDGDSPKLIYTLRGEEQEVSLPDASTQWLVLDMDSLEGLYPDIDYKLTDVSYALEDTEP